jgi:hypothetical protein
MRTMAQGQFLFRQKRQRNHRTVVECFVALALRTRWNTRALSRNFQCFADISSS